MLNMNLKKAFTFTTFCCFSLLSNAGTFDITEAEYDAGLTTNNGSAIESLNMFSYPGNTYYSMMGYDRYVAEMDDEFERWEWRQDLEYVRELNIDLSDNRAHALVTEVKFKIDTNQDGVIDEWYRHGDIIHGSDWDNNGLIDCLEVSKVLSHSPSKVEYRGF